ncbi:C39 family peptidase [Clostridium sp.]|uniref:C39 family peptidase n=1 Tax=Clostridium sp. TaxID=1506 RepID=UPI0032174C32
MNYFNRRRKQTKRVLVTVIGGMLIVLSLIIVYRISNIETNEISYKSEDKDLSSQMSTSDKLNEILSNKDIYPESLIELAEKKSETIDFVYNYATRDNGESTKQTGNFENKKGKFPLFIQWDERWGYEKYGDNFIAINGCGPTSLAMVAVGLTGNTDINPKSVADFSYENSYYVNGIGSSWELMSEGAKQFGLKSKELPLDESVILSTLRNGEPIIATMGPGEFTDSGHYILLTGITDDGKIIVNDSDSKIRSEKKWDIDIFMKETKNLWKFSL